MGYSYYTIHDKTTTTPPPPKFRMCPTASTPLTSTPLRKPPRTHFGGSGETRILHCAPLSASGMVVLLYFKLFSYGILSTPCALHIRFANAAFARSAPPTRTPTAEWSAFQNALVVPLERRDSTRCSNSCTV